ncbi:unnamed protein product [Peronospora farinosa]|uniref:Uncharacterized protein n=1 Tax=Peronospora farinosa TaxID=134698 RepID=A0ABN8C799_9STRA|nr:unnamed protein product [Peronospora farinosa]
MKNSSAFKEKSLHCQQLLDNGTTSALNEAVKVASTIVSLDTTQARGFLLLTEALSRLHRYEDAVTWYKKGLKVHPQNEELQMGLKQARVAVLNKLLEEEEAENEDEALKTEDQLDFDVTGTAYAEKACDAQSVDEHGSNQITQRAQTYVASGLSNVLTNGTKETKVQSRRQKEVTVFQAKMEQVLEHLDVLKLGRLAAVYVFSELLNLKERALRFAQDWVETSTDKLGAFTSAPWIIAVIPVVMKVFGQLKFMLFLQQDVRLIFIVLAVVGVLVANSLRTVAGQQAKLWGEGQRLKFAAYFTTIVYWVFWRGQWADTIRLLGPAFIDAGGIVLGSVTSSDLQEICRRAFKRLYSDVASNIQADVDLDAWFFLGLGNWIVEYWQQPTDFSLDVLSKMLTECFDAMEKAAVRTFSPELRHLRDQVTNMEITDELQLLVAYMKQSLKAVPPRKSFGLAMLFIKRCPSFVVFGLLTVFFGIISLPLVPFVVSEYQSARDLYDCYHTGSLQEKDGLELMLLDSPLVRVWGNVKGCIYCLEGSITFSKAVTTGTHIVSAAAQISRLAVFASRVKKEGVFANAHDIPDHVANVFLITKNSSLMIDGVRYIRDSAQLQDLKASIATWWSGGRVKEEKQD